jgi:hypothetical protein
LKHRVGRKHHRRLMLRGSKANRDIACIDPIHTRAIIPGRLRNDTGHYM